jgi:phage terminase Nu1 subunit (DNA packaging protein)
MILNSWKEIASYLNCSVRTAQRFEQLGMPVRRPSGHLRSAVIAMTDELEAWLGDSRNGAAQVVTRVAFHSERGKSIRAEIAVLKQRMADCRARSTAIRERAAALRARLPFSGPVTSLSR